MSNIDFTHLKNWVLRPKDAGVDFVPVIINKQAYMSMDHQNPRTLQAEAGFRILQP